MDNNCWLPVLLLFENYNGNWDKYENALYDLFRHDFLDSCPTFYSKDVRIRKHPIEYGKEEAFYHVTTCNNQQTGKREPDLRRCERIKWIRSFIEEYGCDSTLCENCDGIKYWIEPYKSKSRVHLLFEEERYVVILESRENYYLLITAFYIDHDHQLHKQIENYRKYKITEEKQKTP